MSSARTWSAASGSPCPPASSRLSPLGRTLLSTIEALVGWTEEHQLEIAEARAAFDARSAAAADAAARRVAGSVAG